MVPDEYARGQEGLNEFNRGVRAKRMSRARAVADVSVPRSGKTLAKTKDEQVLPVK